MITKATTTSKQLCLLLFLLFAVIPTFQIPVMVGKADIILKKNTEPFELKYLNQYHNVETLLEELEIITTSYPEIVKMETIGTSIQGRPIYLLHLTDFSVSRDKTDVLIIGQHHAREQITVEACLRFVRDLINDFNAKDSDIVEYMTELDIYVIPSMNPDGLHYVHANEYLRKNLRAYDDDNDGFFDEDPPEDMNGDGLIAELSIRNKLTGSWMYRLEGYDNDGDGQINEDDIGGVDLNRNYDFHWKDPSCDSGISNDPTSQTFPGDAAFSEPETQAIRDFVLQHRIAASIALHSGINATYFPWSWTNSWADPILSNIRDDLWEILPLRFWGLSSRAKASENLVKQNFAETNVKKEFRPLYTCAGEWGDWMFEIANCQAPMTFEIYHNATCNNEGYIIDNATHYIEARTGMFHYFDPDAEYIEELYQDVKGGLFYWLELTPRVSVTVQDICLNSDSGKVTLRLFNPSPHLLIQENFSINPIVGSGTATANIELISEMQPREEKIVEIQLTFQNKTQPSTLFLQIHGEWIGSEEIVIKLNEEDTNSDQTTDIITTPGFSVILTLIATIPLLILWKNKRKGRL